MLEVGFGLVCRASSSSLVSLTGSKMGSSEFGVSLTLSGVPRRGSDCGIYNGLILLAWLQDETQTHSSKLALNSRRPSPQHLTATENLKTRPNTLAYRSSHRLRPVLVSPQAKRSILSATQDPILEMLQYPPIAPTKRKTEQGGIPYHHTP